MPDLSTAAWTPSSMITESRPVPSPPDLLEAALAWPRLEDCEMSTLVAPALLLLVAVVAADSLVSKSISTRS